MLPAKEQVKLLAKGTPYALECGMVDRRLRSQIVQLGEPFAEPVMVSADHLGDVSHLDQLISSCASTLEFETAPLRLGSGDADPI